MAKFPTKACVVFLLVLISSISCHKKNCLFLPNTFQVQDFGYAKVYFLGSITLSNNPCYVSSISGLPNRPCNLGIYVLPSEEDWKADDAWKNFSINMLVRNSKGKRLIDHSYDLSSLSKLHLDNKESDSTKEPLFLYSGGLGLIDHQRQFDWKSNIIISRFKEDPTVSEFEKELKENPESFFEAKPEETYEIRITVKGICPSGINPNAKIALLFW